MFSKHDPRAEALRAVHEGRATVAGTKSNPEWLIDDEPVWGLLEELHSGGYITFDADAAFPQTPRLTQLGEASAIVLLGIFPARPEAASAAPVEEDSTEDETDQRDDHEEERTDERPYISYEGLPLTSLDFVNGDGFRSIVRKYSFQIELDYERSFGEDEILTTPERLWVLDPSSGARLGILYDDEQGSRLESPGFIELLKLMDTYARSAFQGRIFYYIEGLDGDEVLDAEVSHGHPFYDREFDFTTGLYKRA